MVRRFAPCRRQHSVVAFSWPSLGKLIALPFPDAAYRRDQTTAGQSGLHLMSFLANLEPIVTSARGQGKSRVPAGAQHGQLALQAAVESWFGHGNGDAFLFDEIVLAAADEIYNSFDYLPTGRLSALQRLGTRISTYASVQDAVPEDQHGDQPRRPAAGPERTARPLRHDALPRRRNTAPSTAAGFADYDIDLASSHQYYRRSPSVRMDIANVMARHL